MAHLLEHCSPSQLEALDGRMARLMREEGAYLDSLDTLPEGDSWLPVQYSGDSQEDVDAQAHALLRAVGRDEKDANVAFSDDPEREQKMLRAREAGLGVTARPPDDRETWEGWEDSAVPPERLGDYLRDLKGLFEEFGYDHPSLYGNFGQGCVHTRIPFGLRTAEGVAGFRRFVERAADLVVSYGGSLSGEHGDGQSRGELPCANERMCRAVRNAGPPGVTAQAIAAVDIGLWDLKARLLDVPLVHLLGRARDDVPVYGSGGFTTYDADRQDRQLRGWTEEQGIPRVKIKIGESWGTRHTRDLERVARARAGVGDTAELYVDANGAYTGGQAVRIAGGLADHGVTWFEEPVSSDHLGMLADIRGRVPMDVTAGEYGYTLPYFAAMLSAGAVDCLQADVTRCGGMTLWLRAAALAHAHGLDISGHCAPHAHAHVAAAVPNLRHLEWFHDHVRIEGLLFDGVLDPGGGSVTPGADGALGLGLTLVEEQARRYRVE
ncbi:enolase C-terminal domain-like protein [Streptomyces sp. NPDC015684]|uniref:enolase C-terminal domain-like protein n=1 Tax=Streptomyces sp. NPDC015684 TaxID=3364963 RepID=UPI0036F9036E